ncbi:MAG: SpoIIE family protein phosphatase [Bacteroidetes bacterium]|nr:SpoIIE family protein phosphatase [Bacteroidota bacterium]
MPSIENRTTIFPESFILFKPRDIVSGDFYWYAEKEGKKIIAAVDCTGHGVPGALMSMIGNAFLNEIVNKRGITNPGLILSELRHLVISTLKQSSNQGENKDGMDIALVAFDTQTNSLEFAGANNPLWIYTTDNGEKKLVQIKGDKRPIGYFQGRGLPFTNHSVDYKAGDVAYLFTDGFADQFGGDAGKKFKYKKCRKPFLGFKTKHSAVKKKYLTGFLNNGKALWSKWMTCW